jgi:hypothetical protein
MAQRELKPAPRAMRPEVLTAVRDMLARNFPGLHAFENDGHAFVVGTFQLIEDGVPIDNFTIRIDLPATYPVGLPFAREVGGRLPHREDYHVNPDGTLCVGLPEDLWLRFGGRCELKAYLDGPLRSYFIGALHKLQGRPWPYGEWPHGAAGLREFYGSKIASTELQTIVTLVTIVAGDPVKGHWICPLGCGAEIRRCHLAVVKDLQARLPKEIVTRSLQLLRA